MSLALYDRVRETTGVLGTSDAVLLGAVIGYQSFAVVGNTNTCYYTIADSAGNWEVGLGTYSTTGPTLARTTVLSSSNANAKVSFPAGTKDIFLTYPSEKAVALDTASTIATGSMLYGNGTTSYSSLALGTNGYILQSNGTSPTWVAASSVVGGAGGVNTQVQYNNAGALAGSANMTFNGTTLTVNSEVISTGNLTFSATGQRIVGDFSNASILNRTLLQTSATNAGSYIGVIPNGTATNAGYLSFNSSSDPDNSSYGGIGCGSNAVTLYSSKLGSGTYLPMLFSVNGDEAGRFDTSNRFLIGPSSFSTSVTSPNLFQVNSDATVHGLTVGLGGGSVDGNTAVGYQSAKSNSTGQFNTYLGYNTGYTNTTGDSNTGVGASVLYFNTGNYNTALGYQSLVSNTTASNNTAVGYQAGYSNTTGNLNVFVGSTAGYANTTGATNTAVGQASLATNTDGYNNTAIGQAALNGNTHGYSNTAVGGSSLFANTTGIANIAVGAGSLQNNTIGSYNASVGQSNMLGNTTGSNNSSLGCNALQTNTTGANNSAVGYQALYANNANNNTAVGYQAGFSNTTGGPSTVIGYQAGYNNAGGQVDALGYQAGYANTSGTSSVYIGALSGFSSSAGIKNTFLGAYAGYSATGSYNTFVGGSATSAAGYNMTTGSYNTILGGFNGNQSSLDIRTASNNIVLSDGAGNPQLYYLNSALTWVFPNLPTSAAGLPTGAIWKDTSAGNVIKVV